MENLHEKMGMCPHPALPHTKGQICLFHKALYSLKQSPRAWFDKFSLALLQLDFINSPYDSDLFTHASSRGKVLLLYYVDDMIVTKDDSDGIVRSHFKFI